MAKKIEISGNYFIITDTVTSNTEVEEAVSKLYYKDESNKVFFFTVLNGLDIKVGSDNGYELADLVDSTGSPFTNYDALITFLRDNTGFKLAGSSAIPTKRYINRVREDGGSTTALKCVRDSLLKNTSNLLMIPSGYKATKLYSALPEDGTGDFTVSRNSVATRVNKEGLIEEVAANVPRLDYSDGGCPVLLTEPQSTNSLKYSEDLTNSIWNKPVNTSIVSNYTQAPDGNETADKVVFADTVNTNTYQFYTFLGTTDYIASTYVKGEGDNIGKDIKIGFSVQGTTASKIITLTNEWIRVELPITTGTAGVGSFYFESASTNNATEFIVWGAQLEQGSSLTSYIKTENTTATRLGDAVTDAGDVNTFNSEEGVLYAEISALADDGTLKNITISDGTINNSIRLYYSSISNTLTYLLKVGGVNQVVLHTTITQTDLNKIAVKWKENDFALWVNGIEVETDNNGVVFGANTLNVLNLQRPNGSEIFYGKTKDLRVFKTALSDTELQQLTTL